MVPIDVSLKRIYSLYSHLGSRVILNGGCTATEVKNPEAIRIANAAITLWILRCAQNDPSHFDCSICKSAIIHRLCMHFSGWASIFSALLAYFPCGLVVA